MSSASNARADSSNQSSGTANNLSLGSLANFQSPAHFRVPSASSGTSGPSTAPINTPSPPSAYITRRKTDDFLPGSTPVSKRLVFSRPSPQDNDDDEADSLETPARDTKADAGSTPMPNRIAGSRKASGVIKGSNLTLRDQEKHIDALKKENFNIKLKVHFLEERLAELAPDQIDTALKQNINLKIEVQQRGIEMKKYKKLVLDLERELERLQRGKGKERDLEDRIAQLEQELRQARRRKGSSLQMDESLLQRQNEELERARVELEEEVDNLREALQNRDVELEDLREELERNGEPRDSSNGDARARLEQMEKDYASLEEEFDRQNGVIEDLQLTVEENLAERENLALKVEQLEQRLDLDTAERSESRAQIRFEQDEREELEKMCNELRDKLAASSIENGALETDLEEKNATIEGLKDELDRLPDNIESEYSAALDGLALKNQELAEQLRLRDIDVETLRQSLAESEENMNLIDSAMEDLQHKLNEKEIEFEEQQAAIVKLNSEHGIMNQQLYTIEEDRDTLLSENEAIRREASEAIEQLEMRINAYKNKLEDCRRELQEENERYKELFEKYSQNESELQEQFKEREKLAEHLEDYVENARQEREEHEKALADFSAERKEHDAALRREKREVEAKESALRSALDDLARAQTLIDQRETDFAEAQELLKSLEDNNRKLDESIASDRFSLQLDVDRLKRDAERLESELTRARMDLANREGKTREREDELDKLHSENRDLSTQLSSQTQARLNATEKLDAVQSTLRIMEAENTSQKQRISDLETRLSKDQRSLMSTENQYRDQLTERNTLLLTIYQYMDKVLGVDKTPKGETKPFTNFSVFHDNLISRLKSLSQIQLDFDKKCKALDAKYTDKMSDLRKQLDARWKQLDKFDVVVKNLAEHKQGWKKRLAIKEGEVDALKSTNSELTAQISGLKRPGQGESYEVRSLKARATTAEKQVIIAKNQVAALEERKSQEADAHSAAREKWEARIKELETRQKAADERIKRERQGAKENNASLQSRINEMQRQLELANKRKHILDDVIDSNRPPSSPR